ncbi:MAG TPA: alpha/beta fold hydrolase [Opitutaceae bacterium]|nr:alpha/beta fold hydrolase [Opitutaceae bacterium]
MNASRALPADIAALYPFVPYTTQTAGGATMSYVDEGPRSAEAVLLLHGNPTWSFFYRDLISALRSRRRCVAPDHIGMGLSEKPENYAYRLETRIADVEALVDRLGLTRISLVVHDWGGAIGFGLATRRPELIERIVILNTAAFVSDDIPKRIALCRAGFLGKLIVRGFNGFAWPATWMAMNRSTLTPAQKKGYLWPYDSWANRVAVHEFVRDIPLEQAHPSRRRLAEIEGKLSLLAEVPKQIVWGGKDFCFHDGFLERWRKIYPDAAVHHLADVGHYVLDDSRGEALGVIAGFL